MPISLKTSSNYPTERISFSNQSGEALIGNLINHHNKSWEDFATHKLTELFYSFNPLEIEIKKNDQNHKLIINFKDHRFELPKISDQEALRNNVTYEASLKVNIELINETNKTRKVQEVYLGEYPWITDRGTFVINGKERVAVTQIIRSPGVIFEEVKLTSNQKNKLSNDKIFFAAKIIPDRGSWLKFETSLSDNVIHVIINRSYRLPVTNFLQALGMTIDEIYKTFADSDNGPISFIEETFKHKNSVHDYQSALIEVYRGIRPGDLANIENAKEALKNKFFHYRHYDLSSVGRYKINQRLDLDTPNDLKHRVLQLSDFIAVVKEIIRLNNTPGSLADDIDNLANRRLKMIGELIQPIFRRGLLRMEKNIKERILRLDIENITPQQLVNSRPIVAAVRTFFSLSQLSQYMDQVNPLSEIAQKRRLSAMGPQGLMREYAKFEVRDSHTTHYGRICPVETPEGPNVGLLLNIALYAKTNQYGFLETPYYKVLKQVLAKDTVGEIAGTDLKDAQGKLLIEKGTLINQPLAKKLTQADARKLWPIKPRVSKHDIVYLDAKAEKDKLIISAATVLDDKGYFTQQYAEGRHGIVPGQYEVHFADYVDISQKQILGTSAGLIPFIEKDYVVRSLTGANQGRQAVPLICPQSPIVGTGLEKIVAKYTGQITYAKADGMVVQATGDEVIVDYKNNKESYYPVHFQRSNKDTSINQQIVVSTGQKVKKGQPLIEGMSIADGELALGRDIRVALMFGYGDNFEDALVISNRLVREDLLTNVTISEHKIEVRETKLGPEITTLDIPNISENAVRDLDEEGIIRIGARVQAGDILVGKITPKGEQELSNEERLLRAIFGEKAKEVRDTSLKLPNGKSGKVIGLQIFSRDRGDDLKAGILKQVQVFVAQTRKIQIGDKLSGRHGNKGVVSRILPVEDMPFTADGEPVDLILNPIGVPSRMNIGQLFEAHLGIAAAHLGLKVMSPALDGVPTEKIVELLKEANLPEDGKQQLYSGKTGEPFAERTMVGYMYIYKLSHMIDEKIAVRSTGNYTMVTQQPLSGKSHNGGQRFGEMEVWALEAYGAAHTLQEMLTIKSDDMYGRYKAYESIIKQIDIVSPKVPESFNVLVKELQGLCLKIDLINQDNQLVNAEDILETNLRDEKQTSVNIKIDNEALPTNEELINEFNEDNYEKETVKEEATNLNMLLKQDASATDKAETSTTDKTSVPKNNPTVVNKLKQSNQKEVV